MRFIPYALIAIALVVTAASCGGGEPEQVAFDVAIRGDSPPGESTFEAKQGDGVTFRVSADIVGAVHLHGYDIENEIEPGHVTSFSLTADATGRFALTFHPGIGGHAHEEEASPCDSQLDGVTLALDVEDASTPGSKRITVDAPGFEFDGDNHWHLFVDGKLLAMLNEPSVVVPIDEGAQMVRASLSGPDHCVYGIEAEARLSPNGHDGGGHAGGNDAVTEILLGHLVVQPR